MYSIVNMHKINTIFTPCPQHDNIIAGLEVSLPFIMIRFKHGFYLSLSVLVVLILHTIPCTTESKFVTVHF